MSDLPTNSAPPPADEPLPEPQQHFDQSLSAERGRAFVGQRMYSDGGQLEEALTSAKEALPEVESAYQPSGRMTTLALLSFALVTPIVLILIVLVCGALCVGWGFLEEWAYGKLGSGSGMRKVSSGFAILPILLDCVLVGILCVVPGYTYSRLSKLFKNRKHWVPGLLAAATAFAVSALLFLPVFGEFTLAPTEITFLFIPVKWVLIVLGAFVAPAGSALIASEWLAKQRFCEVGMTWLEPVRTVHVEFDFAEDALEMLKRGEYEQIIQLPECEEGDRQKHCASVMLWWHQRAQTAYLEMFILFMGKRITTGKAAKETANWLAFSARLDPSAAQTLQAAYAT